MLVDINGQKYLYNGVSKEDFNRMTYKQEGDVSVGKLFNAEIKSKYPFKKLSNEEAEDHKLSEVLSGTEGSFVVAADFNSHKDNSVSNNEDSTEEDKEDSSTAKDYVKQLKDYSDEELAKENAERDKLRKEMRKALKEKLKSGEYKSWDNYDEDMLDELEGTVDLDNPYLVDVDIHCQEGIFWHVSAKYIYPAEHFRDTELTSEETRIVETHVNDESTARFKFGEKRFSVGGTFATRNGYYGGSEDVYWQTDYADLEDQEQRKIVLNIFSDLDPVVSKEKDVESTSDSEEKVIATHLLTIDHEDYARSISKITSSKNIKYAAKLAK